MIKISNLSKSYAHQQIIDQVNLEINTSDSAAIMGPSGSGKSTFLQMLAGIILPDEGSIYLQEQDITQLTSNERTKMRRKYIGFVEQNTHLINELTPLENIMLPSLLSGTTKYLAQQQAEILLQNLGLLHIAKSDCSILSGGERQRVAIARAIITHPKYLFLDEPTGNLDKENTQNFLQALSDLNKKYHITILLTTHDKTVAESVKYIFNLTQGKIIAHT